MTTEQKAKAYDEALKCFKAFKEKYYTKDTQFGDVIFDKTGKMQKDFEDIFPELKESEDERIIRLLRELGSLDAAKELYEEFNLSYTDVLYWLEKQKENPKSADSIPSDCVSDAKCEDRWHKTANSLPDNGRDVLAKDSLGNYLLASFDGAQWFVSVYDGEDHPVLHTPPILEWCDIPSEKQKDSKVWKDKSKNFTIQTSEEKEYIRTLKSLISDFIRDKQPENVIYYQRIYDWLDGRHIEQKPVECSEGQLEELNEEVKRYYSDNFAYISSDQPTLSILTNIARHFAEWGADHLRDSTKMVDKSLEEAADKHIRKVVDAAGHPGWDWTTQDIADAFIAGAKWQKEQDDKELSDLLTIAHLQGAEQMEEQMLKDAVEGVVCYGSKGAYIETDFLGEYDTDVYGNSGDKVRLIIVKED